MVASAVNGIAGDNAAKAQESAARQAAATQMKMYEQTRSDLAPYRDFGASMISPLQNLLTGDPATQEARLQSLPGYQFALSQGLQAAQDSAAARGLGSSGAALQGAASYATGLADSTYGNQANRLLSAAGMGQNAAAQTGTFGSQAATQIGQDQTAAGAAQAQADLAIGHALANLPQGIANAMSGAGLFGG